MAAVIFTLYDRDNPFFEPSHCVLNAHPQNAPAQITIKVMSESGNKCLLSLIRMLPIDLMVASISEAAGDAHPMCRAQAAVSLNTVLQRSKCRSLEDELDAM